MPASSSQSIWEEAREGRLPPRAEYRVILLVSSTKSLHDDKRIPTGLRSPPEGLSVYDYGDCEADKVHIVIRGSNESFFFPSFDRYSVSVSSKFKHKRITPKRIAHAKSHVR